MASMTFERDLPGDLDFFRQSKIALPVPSLVSRPRIVGCIEEGTRGKLTVLSAPAGWGKSTALAEWSGTTDRDVAWLCLDEDDNSPTRFLRGLVSSIERVAPGTLADLLAMLRSPQSVSLTRAMDHIVQRLGEHSREIVIVFDHYQVIHNGDIHDGVRLLIDEMPPHLHLAIATRGHLPIPVGRLRAQQHLCSIGIPELRLTVDEARRVLAEHDRIHFAADDLVALVERTEGWVAGLRLAARSFNAHSDPHAAIARFRGTHQDIADFLAEEVIRQIPEDQQSFLLETSVLEVLTAPVCAAVTTRGDAGAMLQETAKADLFLLPLDEERISYRYHGLFRDLLTAELERHRPEVIPELNRRASVWYEQQGMMSEAVTYGLRAADHRFAVDLLDRVIDTLIFDCAETSQVVRWIEQLPRNAVLDHRPLASRYAWALTLVGRLDDAEFVLEQLERGKDHSGSLMPAAGDDIQASIAAIRARIAAYRMDHHATITQAKLALDLIEPGKSGRIAAEIQSSLGFAYRALGRTDQAAAAFVEAARLGRAFCHASAARWSTRYLVVTRIEQGRLREAESLLEEDLERVREDPRDPGASLAALHIGWAEVLIEQNRLAEAREALDPAIPLLQRVGDAKMLMNAYVAQAMLLHAEGKPAEARDRMRRAEDIFPGPNKGAKSAWLALTQGDTQAALRWARTSGFSVDDPADSTRSEHDQMIFARIMARTAYSPEARGLIESLLTAAEAEGRMGRCIELLNILAVTDYQQGNREQARSLLLRSLRLAHHEGFVRIFLEEGPEIGVMLHEIVRDRQLVDDELRSYIFALLRAFGGEAPGSNGQHGGGNSLLEPLTDRQIEILALMAEGRSNREIARDLFIAEGTVKAHVHQLFGKLMARNRTEAVARARELDLLPG
jgi:LuxR family maltose regulon positive regulatory protein